MDGQWAGGASYEWRPMRPPDHVCDAKCAEEMRRVLADQPRWLEMLDAGLSVHQAMRLLEHRVPQTAERKWHVRPEDPVSGRNRARARWEALGLSVREPGPDDFPVGDPMGRSWFLPSDIIAAVPHQILRWYPQIGDPGEVGGVVVMLCQGGGVYLARRDAAGVIVERARSMTERESEAREGL